jgi:hypothetical protein
MRGQRNLDDRNGGGYQRGISAADIDGDSRPDLIFAEYPPV